MKNRLLSIVGMGVWIAAAGAEFPGVLYEPKDAGAPQSLRLIIPQGYQLMPEAQFSAGTSYTITGFREFANDKRLGVSVVESRHLFPLAAPLRIEATPTTVGAVSAPVALKNAALLVEYPVLESHPKDAESWAKASVSLSISPAPALDPKGSYALLAYAAASPSEARLVFARASSGANNAFFTKPSAIQLDKNDERLVLLLVRDGTVIEHRVFNVGMGSLPAEIGGATLARQKAMLNTLIGSEQAQGRQTSLDSLKRSMAAHEAMISTTTAQMTSLKTQILNRLRADLLDTGIVANTASLERRFNDAIDGLTDNQTAQTVAAIGSVFLTQWLDLKQQRDLAEKTLEAERVQLVSTQQALARGDVISSETVKAALSFTIEPMPEAVLAAK